MKNKFYSVDGHDESGNDSFISIHKDKSTNKIHVGSPEECSNVVLTVKEAKELISAIKKCILE